VVKYPCISGNFFPCFEGNHTVVHWSFLHYTANISMNILTV
jgi:hypothetical protein